MFKPRVNAVFFTFFLGLYSLPGHGALLNLSEVPLFLTNSVPPNILFELDDGGSMDWEILARSYWEACAYDPSATGAYSMTTTCGVLFQDQGLFKTYANGSYKTFSFVFQNNDDEYADDCEVTPGKARTATPLPKILQVDNMKSGSMIGVSRDLDLFAPLR